MLHGEIVESSVSLYLLVRGSPRLTGGWALVPTERASQQNFLKFCLNYPPCSKKYKTDAWGGHRTTLGSTLWRDDFNGNGVGYAGLSSDNWV